jgi:hypothetical protein
MMSIISLPLAHWARFMAAAVVVGAGGALAQAPSAPATPQVHKAPKAHKA